VEARMLSAMTPAEQTAAAGALRSMIAALQGAVAAEPDA